MSHPRRVHVTGYIENELAGTERPTPRALELAYAAFLLIAVGRIGELVPGLGSLPLAKVAMGICVLLLIGNRRRFRSLSPAVRPLSRTIIWLVAVAVLVTPFSIWPGQSVSFLILQLPVLAAAMIVCWKISYSWRALRGIIRTLVVAAVVLALSAIAGFHGGRASTTSSMDPNDLAYVLVSTAPLALAFALTARTKTRRLVNAATCAVLVIALLLTSSRGGFFGLIAGLVALVVVPIRRPREQDSEGKWRNRVVLPALGVLCAFAVLWSFLPAETRLRLSTVTELGSDYNMDPSNTTSRSGIWKRNIAATLQRPIGYGVAAFPMVDLRTGGKFKAAHNSYLEVLVELGFLGLVLFLRMYVLSSRALQRTRHTLLAAPPDQERDEILVFARMLQVALIGNAVSGFFLSMAYLTLLWVLFAVVMACVSLVSRVLPETPPSGESEAA